MKHFHIKTNYIILKIFTRHFLTIIVVFCALFFSSGLSAQKINLTDSLTNYFKQRVRQFPYENTLMPLNTKSKVKLKDIEAQKKDIWDIWRKVNQDGGVLLSNLSHVDEGSPVVHSWDLIDEDSMPFYFILKGNCIPADGVPLFLDLHGSGPKDMEFRTTLAWAKRYSDSPSVYFIPRIPNEKRYRWWYRPEQFAWEQLFRLAMLNDTIDVNRIYIIGISEGGYGSQRLGAFYADYLAGAGPMAGGEPLKNAPPLNYRNIAFSFQTGENDNGFGRNFYTRAAKSAFDSLKAVYPADFIHRIELQPNKGHAIDYSMTTPWLIKYSRNTRPMHVSWLYFPMHERFRKGFYNIAISKSPGLKEGEELDRIYFDIWFNRKKNTVTVDATLADENMTKQATITNGAIAIFLDSNYVNLNKKVTVIYNGRKIFYDKVNLLKENLAESCALFGDPERLFPGKVEISLVEN